VRTDFAYHAFRIRHPFGQPDLGGSQGALAQLLDVSPAELREGDHTLQPMVFDAVLVEPGRYPFVDHSMRNLSLGAAGEIEVLAAA
jgi:hypothetical protein